MFTNGTKKWEGHLAWLGRDVFSTLRKREKEKETTNLAKRMNVVEGREKRERREEMRETI